jgi:hypothetical protein
MPFRVKVIFLLFTLCFASKSWSQTGNYFLSHFAPSEERFDYVCFDMTQDSQGVMYFATKAGILEFDGRDWDLLQVQSAVYSIEITSAGEIFWSGAKGYGKIITDAHGFQQAITISDSTTQDVFQSIVSGTNVYFLSDNAIYIYNTKENKSSKLTLGDNDNAFIRIFELFDVIYANTENGILKIEGGKLVTADLDLAAEVVFYSRIDDDYVIGTADNKIYTCSKNLEFKPIVFQDQTYVDASVIISGSWLNRQLLVLGTLRGGVIFLNPINGKTQEVINYSTGLPDNEVFTLMIDVTQNVWVAHDYGFTMIAPFMPINSFSHYQGLQGNLLCAYSSQNTVYVGTSLGAFKLEKVDLYDELVYYVNVEIKEPTKTSGKTKTIPGKPEEIKKEEVKQEDEKAKSESKKGGLFSFLRRKNRDKDKTEDQKVAESKPKESSDKKTADGKNKVTPSPATEPKFRREKRTEKILRSSHFVFKKVDGIDAKINHLVEINGKLIASGLSGVYEISGLVAKPILEEPVRFVYPIEKKNLLIASTYNNGVRSFEFNGKTAQETRFASAIDDQIHYIFEGKDQELWLCGLENIYRAEMADTLISTQPIQSLEKNSDKTIGILWQGEVLLVNPDGFFSFNRNSNDVVRLDSLPSPSQHFTHGGNILYRDVHGWHVLGSNDEKRNLQLLNIFQNLRFITEDKDPRNLWLISGTNDLYKFYSERVTPYENGFPLFLKAVFNQDKTFVNRQEIEMDQEHSSVKFKVVQPDFINPQAIEFRYFLEGMQTGWTEWSVSNDIIDFPYLPNGEYTLQVQAKNIFGKITELEPVYFEVLPPYWKRSWFYALEFAIIASLVILSFRLSTKYRIVSRLLSLLTIILLMQFIQTAINTTITTEESPVTDFFIQVVVAMMALPIEGFLRNLMLRSMNSSGKFYKFLVPKENSPVATKESTPVAEITAESNDESV